MEFHEALLYIETAGEINIMLVRHSKPKYP